MRKINGVIQMTGVASRHVGKYIAVILVLLGLFPVVGRAFTTIPSPVLGGAMVLMSRLDCDCGCADFGQPRHPQARGGDCGDFGRLGHGRGV